MAENSKIEWCDRTFNPWIGCTKVSAGCKNCYAETLMDHRYKTVQWGPGKPRVRTSEAMWRKPLAWNAGAEFFVACGACGMRSQRRFGGPYKGLSPCPNEKCKSDGHSDRVRPRVFSLSLGDWLDPEVPIEWLADLLALIHETSHLDWLLLTKRPELFADRLHRAMRCLDGPWDYEISGWLDGTVPANAWLGVSVEDQVTADARIPALLQTPATVRFLSCEPLLGPVDLCDWYDHKSGDACVHPLDGYVSSDGFYHPWVDNNSRIHWVICGGESGPGARPMHPEWVRSLRDQCNRASVPFFFKQWGGANKKKAGRVLDGRKWNELPETRP